jgi:hypothetical protein
MMMTTPQTRSARFPLALLCSVGLSLGACGGENENDNNHETQDAGGADMSRDVSGGGGDGGAPDAGPDVESTVCGEPTGMRPPQLSEHAGAFVPGEDGSGGTIVVFGGSLGIPENCGFPERTYETTTWLYDVDCDSWSRLESASTPPGRARHTAIYDESNNRVLVYGGLGPGGPLDDTWALDMGTREWSLVETSGGPAPARLNHAAAYDPDGRMLVFGGNQGSSVIDIEPSNDVWALDLASNTWSDVTPAQAGPDPRLWVSALWDSDRSQLVIFGGGDDSAFTGNVDYFEDVWAWSDAGGAPGWEQLDAESRLQPEGRFWAGWTYDPVNQRYLLFGGHDDTNLGNKNDTWFFDPAEGQWAEHLTGDIPNKPPNGVCDFPADFTTIEEASPERRNAHVFVSGATGAYAMGGKTDCGIIDDLARFDFGGAQWEILTRATAGEVCLRKGGGDTCSGLCL